jgi:hypothetical protein
MKQILDTYTCKMEEASHSVINDSPKHVLKAGNLYFEFVDLDVHFWTADFCGYCAFKNHFQLTIEKSMFYKLCLFCLHVTEHQSKLWKLSHMSPIFVLGIQKIWSFFEIPRCILFHTHKVRRQILRLFTLLLPAVCPAWEIIL